jgi:Tol biopolymer transport system component
MATATAAGQAEYPPKVSLTEPGVYLVRPDGSGLRQLASGERRFRPIWSPDGTHIAVVGIVGGAHRVSVIDVDSGSEVTVFDGSGRGAEFWVGNPLWSPDGSRLVVPAGPYQETAGWHAYLVNADGNGEPIDLFEGILRAWSPDGITLAFVEYSSKGVTLQTFDLGTRTPTVIDRTVGLNWFAWSPDSQRMAYTIEPPLPRFAEVVVIDRDGWNRRVITERGSDPEWSPDGQYLAFTDGDGWVNLAAVNTSAKPVRLSPGGVASWSPEGDAVLIWDMSSLRRVSLATHEAVEIIDLAGRVPAATGWVGLSPDHMQMIFSVLGPRNQDPGALFVVDIDGTNLQKLVQFSTGIVGAEWSPDGRYIALVDGRTAIS